MITETDQNILRRRTLKDKLTKAAIVLGMLEDQLPMLKKNDVEDAYLVILAAASSKGHLKDLHDLVLPPDARLSVEDLQILTNIWLLIYGEKQPHGERRMDDGIIALMVTRALTRRSFDRNTAADRFDVANLHSYYLDLLRRGKEFIFAGYSCRSDVCKVIENSGSGFFQVNLCGLTFEIEILLRDDKQMEIWLYSWEHELTEEITYQLRQLPGFKVNNLDELGRSHKIGLGWELPWEKVSSLFGISAQHDIYPSDEEAFMDFLTAGLKELEIPLSGKIHIGKGIKP